MKQPATISILGGGISPPNDRAMILHVEEEHIHNHVQGKPGHWEGAAQVRGLCLASSVKGCEGKSSRATVVHKQLKLMG